jgi:hypothetical protein
VYFPRLNGTIELVKGKPFIQNEYKDLVDSVAKSLVDRVVENPCFQQRIISLLFIKKEREKKNEPI